MKPPPPPPSTLIKYTWSIRRGADGSADGIFLHLRQRFTFTDKTCFSPGVVRLKSESGFKGPNLETLFWESRAASGRMGNWLPDKPTLGAAA